MDQGLVTYPEADVRAVQFVADELDRDFKPSWFKWRCYTCKTLWRRKLQCPKCDVVQSPHA